VGSAGTSASDQDSCSDRRTTIAARIASRSKIDEGAAVARPLLTCTSETSASVLEEVVGWLKSVGGFHRTRYRGLTHPIGGLPGRQRVQPGPNGAVAGAAGRRLRRIPRKHRPSRSFQSRLSPGFCAHQPVSTVRRPLFITRLGIGNTRTWTHAHHQGTTRQPSLVSSCMPGLRHRWAQLSVLAGEHRNGWAG
jgi:hypothetical protein